MAASTIQFTGEQARAFADVTPEAWRHWRKVVPTLAAKQGKKARFSAGEMIGLAVIASAITKLGIGVSGLGARWEELFTLCAQQRLNALHSICLVITADTVRFADANHVEVGAPAVVIPCAPLVDRLWSAALSGDFDQSQVPLPFAPQVVSGNRS